MCGYKPNVCMDLVCGDLLNEKDNKGKKAQNISKIFYLLSNLTCFRESLFGKLRNGVIDSKCAFFLLLKRIRFIKE